MCNIYIYILATCFLMPPVHLQHIRMVYERSCDTEDWSNDAENRENDALSSNTICKYIKTENSCFKL